jgi:tRNA threonylcarbamoyladenosine biosynthesis protein TsaB
MMILGIETAGEVLSVVLLLDDTIIASVSVNRKNAHDELLTPVIESVFRFAARNKRELSAVAVSIGPGSFTGLRIGLAAAKGISLSLDVPLITVPTFDAMAYAICRRFILPGSTVLATVFDARRGDVYLAEYQLQRDDFTGIRSACAINANHAAQELAAGTLLAGNGAQKIFACDVKKFDIVPDLEAGSHAEAVAFLGKVKFFAGAHADRRLCEPLYVRDFHTTSPKPLFD